MDLHSFEVTVGNIISPSANIKHLNLSGYTHHVNDKVSIPSSNKTLASSDSGVIQRVLTDGLVITLPTAANVSFATFVIENASPRNGSTGVTVGLQTSSDIIKGGSIVAGAGKSLINTKATSQTGDLLVIQSNGVDGYYIQKVVGVWNRQA